MEDDGDQNLTYPASTISNNVIGDSVSYQNLMVSLHHNRVPRAEGQILCWEDGEDSTAQVVLQSQSFVHHLELKAIITIIKFMNGITIKDRKSPEADDEIKMIPWEEKVRKLSWTEVRVTYNIKSSSLLLPLNVINHPNHNDDDHCHRAEERTKQEMWIASEANLKG